ncbi:hypothetical protein E2C01_007900 [Portunus trituberculatus]|uniref:Uncharacterized protein n=1 Tax=Portunus trituberculatus TaxID=210409 RepID=A0A5B7CZC1_PORTR|nr:hypothetical protein [Portunus trituberculatus]
MRKINAFYPKINPTTINEVKCSEASPPVFLLLKQLCTRSLSILNQQATHDSLVPQLKSVV